MTKSNSWLETIWQATYFNLGTKVISVVIAIVLWTIVLGSRNVEVTKEIPLEIMHASDLEPANEIPEKISFKLSGPKAFLRTVLDRHEEPIRVNLSGSKPGLVPYRFFADNIRVPIGVKVLSINPAAILVKLEYLKHKEVPVKVELRGAPPDGFRIVKTEVHPAEIRVKGADSRIEAVTEVRTSPIDVSGMKQSVDREVPLDLDRYNVRLDGPLPRVLIEIEASNANYRIKNVDIRVLSEHKVKIDESAVTVLVRAASRDLKSLDKNHVYAEIDLRGRPRGKYENSEIKVRLPENISLVKVIPERVNVTLY